MIGRRPRFRCALTALVLCSAVGCKPPPADESDAVTEVIVEEPIDLALLPPAPEGGVMSNADSYYVLCTTSPDPIPLNEPFSLEVMVYESNRKRPVRNITVEADGRMPDHRHGMNREPSVVLNKDGSFTVENMLFHMPGFWELHLDITRRGMTERAQLDIDLQ